MGIIFGFAPWIVYWVLVGNVPFRAAVLIAFAVAVAAQILRWWCIATLGHQWNTRVVVVPNAGRVTRGPYRLFSHPNYVAVVAEGIALPLVHSAWITALVFTAANAVLLWVRISVENKALESLTP